MKFGVFAPLAGPFATGDSLNLLGPAVEERGFDSLWTALDALQPHADSVSR
jgi:hypothetical protein